MFTHKSHRMIAALALALVAIGGGALTEIRFACAATTHPAPADELVIGPNQSGNTCKLGDHPSVRVEVIGNASTGYQWSVAKVEGNALEQVGGIDAVDHQPIMPGSSSTIIFHFRPVKTGTATITLINARPWEKDKSPAETRTVTIVVDKAPAATPATQP